MSTLPSLILRAWSSLADSPPGLVIALSGGPDSVALVRSLIAVRPDPDVPLVLAHLNHLLRGPDSDQDEAFVVDLHGKLSRKAPLLLARERIDVGALARQERANLEAVARRERYRWLAEVARQHGLRFVATGHTASDQAETVLHRLLRGTGLDGLRGIAFRHPIAPDVEVVRPMLAATREEVLAYLREVDQPAREDSSNADRRFVRNRIRHELLPVLARDYNPRIVEVLGRLARQAEEVGASEEEQAERLLAEAELPRAGSMVVLCVDRLAQAPRRLVRVLFRLVWRRERWLMAEMGFAEYERLADLIGEPRGAWDLPGKVHVRRLEQVLQLHRR